MTARPEDVSLEEQTAYMRVMIEAQHEQLGYASSDPNVVNLFATMNAVIASLQRLQRAEAHAERLEAALRDVLGYAEAEGISDDRAERVRAVLAGNAQASAPPGASGDKP